MADELQDLKDQLKEAKDSIESLVAKNKELLGEVKSERSKRQEAVDYSVHKELEDKYSELQGLYKKLETDSKSTVEKLESSLSQKDTSLQNVLIDNGLNDALVKAGVKPEFMEATKALLRSQAKLDNVDGNYVAKIGDKPLSDHVTAWAESDGKAFISAPNNQGGGANGSQGGGENGASKYFDKSSPDFSLTEQARILKENPALYTQLKG